LGGNQITEIPFGFGKLPKLKKIYLWGNPLKEIPIEIATLPDLQLLYITKMELETTAFSAFLKKCTKPVRLSTNTDLVENDKTLLIIVSKIKEEWKALPNVEVVE